MSAGVFERGGVAVVRVGCPVCMPYLLPISERLGESHFSVALGDALASCFLDGVQVWDVYEVVCGPGGWAKYHPSEDARLPDDPSRVVVAHATTSKVVKVFLCPCGSGRDAACSHTSDGFSIQKRGPRVSA